MQILEYYTSSCISKNIDYWLREHFSIDKDEETFLLVKDKREHRESTIIVFDYLTNKRLVKTLVFKKYKDGQENNDYLNEFVKWQYQQMNNVVKIFSDYKEFYTIKPFYVPSLRNTLLFEFTEGINLHHLIHKNKTVAFILRKEIKEMINYFYLCGKWLRIYQKNSISTENQNIDYIIRFILTRKDILIGVLPTDLLNTITKILKIAEKNLKKEYESVCLHSDFKPNNIMVNKTNIGVIDIGGPRSTRFGCEYFDFTKFIVNIEALKYYPLRNLFFKKYAGYLIQEGNNAFCDGYFYDRSNNISDSLKILLNLHYLAHKLSFLVETCKQYKIQNYVDCLQSKFYLKDFKEWLANILKSLQLKRPVVCDYLNHSDYYAK